MEIPFMRLDRQYKTLKDEFLSATDNVLTHGRVLQGKEVVQLETELSQLFNLEYASTVNSGTDALLFALKSLELTPGSKVAVTSLSFVASASAIVNAGHIPIFIDIDEYYLSEIDIMLDMIQKREIDAIIAVHLFGQMIDLSLVYPSAKSNNIPIIEDAAQCLGAHREEAMPGKYSDAVCLSFDPTKVIGAFGSGGAVLTNNQKINDYIKKYRYHGHRGNRVYDFIGYNSQMPSLQASFISIKLKHLSGWQDRRTDIAKKYSNTLANISDVEIPQVLIGNIHIWHKYVVTINNKRDDLIEYLKDDGISTSIHYSRPLHLQPCFSKYASIQREITKVEQCVNNILSLPIYPDLTDDEVNYICDSIELYFNE